MMGFTDAGQLSPFYKPKPQGENVTGFFQPLHRKVIAGALSALFLVLLVASCTPNPQPAYMGYGPVGAAPMAAPAAVAPVIVTAPQSHSGFGDAFAGSMAGSVLGSMIGNSFSGNRNNTTIVERHVPAPTTTAPAQRYVTPSYRPPTSQVYTNSRNVTTRVATRPSGRTSISSGTRR